MDSRLFHGFDKLALGALLSVACVDVPDAPARQAELSADYAAFDHPTATLSPANVAVIVSAFAASAAVPQGGGAFALLHKLVSDSNQALANEAGLLDDFTVAGSAEARLPCSAAAGAPPTVAVTSALSPSRASSPGLAAVSVPSVAAAGEIMLTLGVENSKIQRALRGSVEHCELLLIGSTALPAMTMGTADLTLDLGGDLEIGAELTLPILVRVTSVRADSPSTVAVTALPPSGYEFRLTNDGAVQLLIQAAMFSAPVGTVVVTLSADGGLGVRDKRGAWTCPGNHAPCTLGA
ncbi:MAG TPA: hypothetical protein VGI10_00135 [Polyangiaceae bacterium]